MRADDLIQLYARKTDDELLQLASEHSELTLEAAAVLKGELSRRHLDALTNYHGNQDSPPASVALHGSSDVKTTPFIGEVVRLYHRYFWHFFALVIPAVVIGFYAVVLSGQEARELARHAFLKAETVSEATVLDTSLMRLAGFCISWIAFSFSFAAVCSLVEQIESDSALSIGDSVGEVLRHCGRVLRLSTLLFALCLVAYGVAGLAISGVIWGAIQLHTRLSGTEIWLSSFFFMTLTLLLLSRFSLAMPCVIVDDYKITQAMFRSDELTRGKWSILSILVSKSLLGGYLAASAPFWIASWISRLISLPSWAWWVATAGSMAGTAMIEPYMFVGFTLLYLRTSQKVPEISAI